MPKGAAQCHTVLGLVLALKMFSGPGHEGGKQDT